MEEKKKKRLKGSALFRKGRYYPVIYAGGRHWYGGTGYDDEDEARTTGIMELWIAYRTGELRDKKDKGLKKRKEDTLGEVWEQWKDMVMPYKYKSKSQQKTAEGNMAKHVIPVLGDIPIRYIDTMDIQQLFYRMRVTKWEDDPKKPGRKMAIQAEPAAATKKKVYQVLNAVFDKAVVWGLRAGCEPPNPCGCLELEDPGSTEKIVWSMEDLTYFFSLPYVRASKYCLPLEILATTGMRRSECCGLQRQDFDGESVTINRGLDIYGNYTDLKSKKSHRVIYLIDALCGSIEEHLAIQKLIARHIPGAVIPVHICTDEFNRPITPNSLTENFRRFIQRNNRETGLEGRRKLEQIQLKNLRHTFASYLIFGQGTEIETVSRILGHSKISTTQNFYLAVPGQSQKTAVASFGEAFAGRRPEKDAVEPAVEPEKKGAASGH